MPTPSYDLFKLGPHTFEHMINMLALAVLGAGHTGFGPGPDGGRDGYFEGSAPYPSKKSDWSGRWYIQSKFMSQTQSASGQKWFIERLKEELEEFSKPRTARVWPDNWIVATNIEPSGLPETGCFDKAKDLVRKANPALANRFHIWGGRKVLDLLGHHPEVSRYYAEFVTPGQVLARVYEQVGDATADIKQIVRHLVVTQLVEQQYTKLEQAGSSTDNRPGIQRLFTELPFVAPLTKSSGMAAATVMRSSAQNHRLAKPYKTDARWKQWYLEPGRARVWFVKGGPGQGKSTLTQYVAQIHRAALILDTNGPIVGTQQRSIAEEIRAYASSAKLWPVEPRVPFTVELKEYAQWYHRTSEHMSRRVLAFLSQKLTTALGQDVLAGTLSRAFTMSRWLFVFDGLDEVPGDVKDAVAAEVTHFVDDVLVGCETDALIICTSRPQGYSGQFNNMDAATVELSALSPEQALLCATPVLSIDRSTRPIFSSAQSGGMGTMDQTAKRGREN